MEKESDHLDDFAPELAMVTKFGNEARLQALRIAQEEASCITTPFSFSKFSTAFTTPACLFPLGVSHSSIGVVQFQYFAHSPGVRGREKAWGWHVARLQEIDEPVAIRPVRVRRLLVF